MDDVRAWKDPAYRRVSGFDATAHPAGSSALHDLDIAELDGVGGAGTAKLTTHGCCRQNFTVLTLCSLICQLTYHVC